MPPTLASARSNSRLSGLIARRAVREARAQQGRGTTAVAAVVAAHQLANATTSDRAVVEMLAEQAISVLPDARLNPAAFTTDAPAFESMLAEIDRKAAELLDRTRVDSFVSQSFDRLVESIVQDAARAAEQVAVTIRPNIWHVRFANLPCCSRCAILAGRVYRWSSGFLRHPGDDCSMIPTTVASPLRQDPEDLLARGLIGSYRTDPATGQKRFESGLSKADMRALDDGADLGRVVNVRSRKAGLMESGQALLRGGRPTPVAIYRTAGDDRALAIQLLTRHGYIR